MINIKLVEGRLLVKDQTREYMDRGHALDNWSYLDYFLGTYDGKILPDRTCNRGRPASIRVPYLESSDRTNRCRVLRSDKHETMPYFPGQWFPKRDIDDASGLFEASMLALLKPWRLLTDLKTGDETFQEAFQTFLSSAPQNVHNMIDNIQFYHECADKATSHRSADEEFGAVALTEVDYPSDTIDDNPNPGENEQFNSLITEEDIVHTTDRPFTASELLYADTALNIGHDFGALSNTAYDVPFKQIAPSASLEQQNLFRSWNQAIHAEVITDDIVDAVNRDAEPFSVPLGDTVLTSLPSASQITTTETLPVLSTPTSLNEKQRMVHNIVANHLHSFLKGENPPQRLMIVHGQGGTGKSALLNSISKTFTDLGSAPLLAKTAMSGVAASIIRGQTLHSWASLPIAVPKTDQWLTRPGKEVEKRRKTNMENVLWLSIDEKSMMTSPQLHHLSQSTGIVRSSLVSIEPSMAFGGLSVILFGDFHQFPPVANPRNALYNAVYNTADPKDDVARRGRALYEQFDVVIKLDEQMRIRDPTWQNILNRTRTGDCTSHDIDEIQKLVLSHPMCTIPDYSVPPWNDAVLITPRNGTRILWNEHMLASHCRKTGEVRYVYYARDSHKQQPLSQQQRLTIARMKPEQTARLPNKVELAIGMKAMVLLNIAPHVDLANGSRGTITDIVLDPRETARPDTSNIVILQYPPAAVIFQPYNCNDITLPGLPVGMVPIFPTQATFRLGDPGGIAVHRLQLALTAAYAFTDYKAQGQTMECVLIDLGKPPTGALTGFTVYVTLS